MPNIRYADDIVLYAKSLNEFEIMTEKFVYNLRKIGIYLNTKKFKILRYNFNFKMGLRFKKKDT